VSQASDWHITNSYRVKEGVGIVVERHGQLGFAKLNGIRREKLAACLAHLVGVHVPPVEIGKVEGQQQGPFAISYIHSPRSYPLATKQELSRDYCPTEKFALKAASGLLAFLVWIAANDHHDDTNLVVDDLGNNLRIVAIDFEHAFRWEQGEDVIKLPAPPGLVANVDPALVTKQLVVIENLTALQISGCCDACDFQPQLATQIAAVLQRRQRLVRKALCDRGWLE
jgi:hypothetical protein